jgi:hypothetical protein
MGLVAVACLRCRAFLWMPGKTHRLHRVEFDNEDKLRDLVPWLRGCASVLARVRPEGELSSQWLGGSMLFGNGPSRYGGN